MATTKIYEQQPVSPGSFNEFQQHIENNGGTQEQPLITRYTQALVDGSFEGSLEDFERTEAHSEAEVAICALGSYTEALKAFRDSQERSLPTEA